MFVQMDPRGILSVIFRQLRTFMLVFVPIVTLGVLYILLAAPTYESTAKLLVKFGQDARPEMSLGQNNGGSPSAEEKRGLVLSNLNILNSRDVATTLLEEITLERAYPEIAAKTADKTKALNSAIKSFQADLKTESESAAGIINVTFEHEDPAMAATILRRLIDIFIDRQAEIFGNPQTDVLREQASEASKRLEEANKNLYAYKAETGITSIEEELTMLLKQRGDLAGYLSRRSNEPESQPNADLSNDPILLKETNLQNTTASALPMRTGAEGDTSRFPVIDNLQDSIDALRAKEAELLQTYRANSDQVRNVRRNIATLKASLDKSVNAINDQILDLDRQIADKQRLRATYDHLTRQVTLAEEAHKTARERVEVAEINNDLTQRKITRISVIEQPTVPFKPSHPQKTLILLLCLFIGATLGAALCLAIEILDSTFTRADQLSNALGRDVLASFQRLQKKGKALPNASLAGLYQAIESAASKGSRVVYLASCYPGEGPNTVGVALAHFAAETMGKRVLCIGSKSTKSLEQNATLLSVATNDARLEDAILEVETRAAPFSYALLAEDTQSELVLANLDKLRQTIETLKKSFDIIIIAAAGVVTSAAAHGLSRLADDTVFVVEAERTRAPVVKQALEKIAASGSNVLGLVLNKRRFYIPQWLYQRL